MANLEETFSMWFMKAGVTSPEACDALPAELGNDLDVFGLPDGRTVWAQFYGEGPRESVYEGTEAVELIGHIHFDNGVTYESYLLALDGKVLRVVTDQNGGGVLEGPTETDPEQQLAVIELLDPYFFPQDQL